MRSEQSSPPHKLTDRQRRARYTARRLALACAVLAVAVLLLLADWHGLFGRRPKGDRRTYAGKTFGVVRTIDGDTIDLDIADTVAGHPTTRVRLWGVDTPETKRPDSPVDHFGPEASRFTRDACLGKQIRVELEPNGRTRGNYGRLLAWVYLPDGRMLNRVLIAEGYGYADPRFDHHLKRELADLMRKARTAKLGLWRNVKRTDLPAYLRR